LTFEIHDLSIAAGEDLGFAHFTLYCCATGPDGTAHPCWLRASSFLRRVDGTWLIAHDHCSAPFNPMTEQVMLDAGPDALKQARAA
jgi:ketosteroid isomerase-like protein